MNIFTKRSSLVGCAVALGHGFLVIGSVASAQERPEPKMADVSVLRKAEGGPISGERKVMIQRLLAIVTSGANSDDDVAGAMVALGTIRASESISALSQRLVFLPKYKGGLEWRMDSDWPTEMYFPACYALVRIGFTPELMRHMKRILEYSDVPLERELACWVLMQTLGREEAHLLLGKNLGSIPIQGGSKLQSSISYINTYKSRFGYPGTVWPPPRMNLKIPFPTQAK